MHRGLLVIAALWGCQARAPAPGALDGGAPSDMGPDRRPCPMEWIKGDTDPDHWPPVCVCVRPDAAPDLVPDRHALGWHREQVYLG